VSDQESDRVSDNLGDVAGAVPTASKLPDVAPAPAAQPAQSISVEAPKTIPEQSAVEQAKETPKAEPAKPEAPKVDAQPSASPGQILIMPREQAWNGADQGAQTAGDKPGMFGKRRAAALAAVIALAAVAGAVGGALATAGMSRLTGAEPRAEVNHALEDSIPRIESEIAALRTSLEQASKHTASQLSKSSDRLERVEKAQAEPAAKLAKLTETVEKLRLAAATPPPAPIAAAPVAAAPVAAAAVAPKETTATVQTANAAPGQIPMPAPKPEVARLPTVEGWVLRDAANGSALIEGRQGIFEVYAGDPIPGLGRIDAIRKQDGRWVVVTSRGLIVGR
jgi:hypothetical protein